MSESWELPVEEVSRCQLQKAPSDGVKAGSSSLTELPGLQFEWLWWCHGAYQSAFWAAHTAKDCLTMNYCGDLSSPLNSVCRVSGKGSFISQWFQVKRGGVNWSASLEICRHMRELEESRFQSGLQMKDKNSKTITMNRNNRTRIWYPQKYYISAEAWFFYHPHFY